MGPLGNCPVCPLGKTAMPGRKTILFSCCYRINQSLMMIAIISTSNLPPFPLPLTSLLISTFSTTCFLKEQTLVEQEIVMLLLDSYWLETP